MNAYLGEIAALLTAISFSFTSTFFTLAGRKVGSEVVNRTRLLLATLLLTGIHWALYGQAWPPFTETYRWAWMGISGVVGLALGDAFLFQAFIWIGPRLSMLMMSLAPALAALVAFFFLDEALSALQLLGMAISIGGIGWVISDRGSPGGSNPTSHLTPRQYAVGILFGLGAATGQALGLILSKIGLAGDYPVLSGNLIRIVVAAAFIWLVTLFQGKARANFTKLREQPKTAGLLLGGTLLGPIIGVSFSLLAVQKTEVGIASTIMALPPVFLLPLGYIIFKERFGWKAITGTLIALSGVAILFLS